MDGVIGRWEARSWASALGNPALEVHGRSLGPPAPSPRLTPCLTLKHRGAPNELAGADTKGPPNSCAGW